jgi:basic membrane lipoprotein Med (substrate-binding protein (PBP1-ABC) superfamily)/DNA-binding SARP family transcriptional activator
MEFSALGPISVTRNDEAVDLGSPRQKAVLALLLVHHGQVLSTDRILEELWGDESDGKLNALRVYVSRLRAALDPDRERGEQSVLETVGSGYRLNVDGGEFDVEMFERRAAEGRSLLASDPAAAGAELRAALDLWSGAAFEDYADEEFAHFESVRLGDARVDAIEDRIEADLACGLDGEVVSELELLRQQYPLRERLVEYQALALYRSGRAAETLREIGRFRRHVGDELGIDPSPRLLRLEEHVLLHDEKIQSRRPAPELGAKRPATNPFKGLRAFGTDDASTFFGRDALTAEILRNLGRGQRLIALVGASGSGKSSVVRAGLIPALAKGAIEGSDRWLTASMLPGAHPFAELDAALLRSTMDAPASLGEQLRDGAAGLLGAALRILPGDDSHLVLIIDQFEELFTLVDDDAVRTRFLSNLVTAVDDPHRRISVVLTLRADFYAHQLTHPEFGARLGAGIVNVTQLTAEELEEAALRPAEAQGVTFEPALLGQLIADVGNQPGALPLFQYALTELFDRRTGDVLTAASYRAMGGLDGALQRRATDLYDELDERQQEAARQLCLRLVTVGDGDERSRRRVPAREIASLAVDPVAMQTVIERFGDHRLLSFDSDHLTGAPTVEVAHEALLSAWPTLERWVDQHREDLRRHSSLARALHEWELADEDPDYLLTSARVAEFDGWAESSPMALNERELEFLAASRERLERERAEAAQRERDEVRARRRLWGAVAALGVTLGVAGLFLFGVLGGEDDRQQITFFGNRNDRSFNANIASGLDRAAREFDLELTDVPWAIDPGAELRELAESGPEIIVSDGVGYAADPSVTTDFPDIRFAFLDVIVDDDNASSAVVANEEGAYVAGAAAALKSETGIVGFIGGVPIPLIDEFQAGFEAGARAIDPDITVLVTYVDQFGEMEFSGFSAPDIAADRARALFRRGADVVFAAAGQSGFGLFDVVVEESEAAGRQLWTIGVDNDQWFQVDPDQQAHMLTSVVKRGDVAAFELVRAMLETDERVVLRLGGADGVWQYSQQGDGLTPEMIGVLDQIVDDIAARRLEIPLTPTEPILLLDRDGNEVDGPEGLDELFEPGVDGLGGPIEPGTVEITALGTPLTLTFDSGWQVPLNAAGHTVVVSTDPDVVGDVNFLRPHLLTDPTQPGAAVGVQDAWPLDDIEGWLGNVIDGIVTAGPERVQIGGRDAVYFEAEITDRAVCGNFGYCAGFFVNTIDEQGNISGWAFQPGVHQQIWWVDQDDEPPLAIIVVTPSADRSFEQQAATLLDALVIGDPEPHPVPYEESGIDR